MRDHARGRWLATVALGIAAATGSVAAQGLEPFVDAQRRADELAGQKKWAEAAAAYGAFAAQHAADPSAPLASVLQGIILRRERGRPAEARAAFGRALGAPDTPFGRELRDIARAWLARLQMEELDAALRKYYVARVEYPETLDGLVERKLATAQQLVDPWGKPFGYKVGKLRIAPDVPRQAYTLSCTAIEGHSRQFKDLLKASAAFAPSYRIKEITDTYPVAAYLAPADQPAKRVVVNEGAKLGSATVVKITRRTVVLREGERVAVLCF